MSFPIPPQALPRHAATGRLAPWRLLLMMMTWPLGGCVSGGFHSNQPLQQQYYLHAASAPHPAAAGTLSADRSLEVLLPSAAPGLEGDGIAVLRTGQRLDYYSGARWAAPVPQMLQELIIESLRAQGHFALVEADTAPFAADWVLQVELAHFEADDAGDGAPTVHVGLVCTLGQRGERRAVTTVSIQTQASAGANRMQAVIEAFQQATTKALGQLATRLSP